MVECVCVFNGRGRTMSVVCIVMYYSQTIKEYSERFVLVIFFAFFTHSLIHIYTIYISIYIYILIVG